MNKLKYLGYSIVFQEVPDEVTLAINISGCPHRCEGCHSKYLWEYEGNYISDDLQSLIEKYKGLITCVCFMGGDQNFHEVVKCFKIIKSYGLKTCLYSGLDSFPQHMTPGVFDYIKLGHYDANAGGLDKPTTNQMFWKLSIDEQSTLTKFENLTYKFQKGYRNDQN